MELHFPFLLSGVHQFPPQDWLLGRSLVQYPGRMWGVLWAGRGNTDVSASAPQGEQFWSWPQAFWGRRLLSVQKVRTGTNGYRNLLWPGWVGTDRENSTLKAGEVMKIDSIEVIGKQQGACGWKCWGLQWVENPRLHKPDGSLTDL